MVEEPDECPGLLGFVSVCVGVLKMEPGLGFPLTREAGRWLLWHLEDTLKSGLVL